MKRPGERPYRATVYLPGHDETGRAPKVREVACTTEAGLWRVLDAYTREGYRIRAYEVLTLQYDDDEESPDAH